MNYSKVALLTFGCLLGLILCSYEAMGQYYSPYYGAGAYGRQGGAGGGGFLWLIGLIFIIIVLFGFNRNTTTATAPSLMMVNVTG